MTFDTDGYPSEETLKEIESFDLGERYKNLPELFEIIRDHWHWDHYFRYDPEKNCLQLHTGGWSGNEDIIAALRKQTWFWHFFWYKSQRGGHYWFELYQFDEEGKKCSPRLKL